MRSFIKPVLTFGALLLLGAMFCAVGHIPSAHADNGADRSLIGVPTSAVAPSTFAEFQAGNTRAFPISPDAGVSLMSGSTAFPARVATYCTVTVATPTLPDGGGNPMFSTGQLSAYEYKPSLAATTTKGFIRAQALDQTMTKLDGGCALASETCIMEQSSYTFADVAVNVTEPGELLLFAASGVTAQWDGGGFNVTTDCTQHPVGNTGAP